MRPTMYLRVLIRMEIDSENSSHEHIAHKPVEVIQQFWQHESGTEMMGDMFTQIMGSWRDLPKVHA